MPFLLAIYEISVMASSWSGNAPSLFAALLIEAGCGAMASSRVERRKQSAKLDLAHVSAFWLGSRPDNYWSHLLPGTTGEKIYTIAGS
jgi:hypothetical protein